MSLTDKLREAGFKPSQNTDGEFKPYTGTYKVETKVLRPDVDDKGQKFYQAEWNIIETLEGMPKRDSKYSAFRKRYFIDDPDKGLDNLKKLLNDFFTIGVELDQSSDEAFEESFKSAIGSQGYIRGWEWTPDGKDRAQQSFVIQKAQVAEKKRSTQSLPF